MTKTVSLDRLRDISKQRSLRRPIMVRAPADSAEGEAEVPAEKAEWPISH